VAVAAINIIDGEWAAAVPLGLMAAIIVKIAATKL
jgi:hypothetical protein